jgi:hypothetical protein
MIHNSQVIDFKGKSRKFKKRVAFLIYMAIMGTRTGGKHEI